MNSSMLILSISKQINFPFIKNQILILENINTTLFKRLLLCKLKEKQPLKSLKLKISILNDILPS